MQIKIHKLGLTNTASKAVFLSSATRHPSLKVYEVAYEGDIPVQNLSELETYLLANDLGISLSFSDIVEVVEKTGDVDAGCYCYESFGFVKTDTDDEDWPETEEEQAVEIAEENEDAFMEAVEGHRGALERVGCPICGEELLCLDSSPVSGKDGRMHDTYWCGDCDIGITIDRRT